MAIEFRNQNNSTTSGPRSTDNTQPPTYHLGLIGRELSHSLSPTIFKLIADQLEIHVDYRLYPVADAEDLDELLRHAFTTGIHGLNVTYPYKADVARLIGSKAPVNTISRTHEGYRGQSTDGRGFVASAELAFAWPITEMTPIAIIGAGGAVSSILSELVQHVPSTELRIFCRAGVRASLAKTWPSVRFSSFNPNVAELRGVGLLVHATSLVGDAPELKWWREVSLDHCQAIMDINYGERLTSLYHRAVERGLPAADGLGMLAAQACLSAGIWFGRQPSFDEILRQLRFAVVSASR